VGYNQTAFDYCLDEAQKLRAKVDDCLNYEMVREDTRTEDAKCECWKGTVSMINLFKKDKFINQLNEAGEIETKNCVEATKFSSPFITKTQRNCTETVIECKGYEDSAIAIINSCQKNDGGRLLISDFRSFLEQEEEEHQDDFELYDDYDEFDVNDYFSFFT